MEDREEGRRRVTAELAEETDGTLCPLKPLMPARHVALFPVARRRRLREARANAIVDDGFRRSIAPDPVEGEPPAAS